MLLGGSKFDVNVVEAEVRKMDRADVNLVKVGIDGRDIHAEVQSLSLSC